MILKVKKEYEILSGLQHSNIIQAHDIVSHEHSGQFYIILDKIEGASLSNYVQSQIDNRLPELEALRVFSELLEGVCYL